MQPQHLNTDGNKMKTIRTKVFSFSELNEAAQQQAIKDYRNNGINTDHIYDEAQNTVKEFNDLFGTKEDSRSWLEIYTGHIDDNIMNLKGLRLRTYIINNFGHKLYKGKYFSLWSKTEKSYKHYKDGYPVLKSRYSKVIFDNCCVLTGVCYDNSILQPVYDFIENYKGKADYYSYMDFEMLMNDCIAELEKDIESEVDAMNGNEYITEQLENNDQEYTKDGKEFNY